MKLCRLISFLLVTLLLISALPVVASAHEADLAETGYYNQDYLEDYASAAYNETGLGCTYTPSSTTFKVWAPEANLIQVKRYTTGTDNESGAAVIGTDNMTYDSTTGIWSKTISGDLKDQYYTFIINRNGTVSETQDPYAKAVGANGNRSMVCDLDSTDPVGWENDQHVLFDNPGEAVVWEIHIRDFSIDPSSGVSEANRGKYLAFTEGDTTLPGTDVATCIDYLVEHNVNCVQLMPIEDFASVDETDDAPKRNWGYDPKNYNVPEGSYSSNPYDGNTRIKEFKMLVQALHDRGISVVMDVVYNHTFIREGSPFNLTTPKYYYRMSSANTYHDGTGLGNTLATEKKMVSKYISESLCYWANEYHIDGFRFDLMGCFDVTNAKIWRQNLDKIDSRILMYGEPWAGGGDIGINNPLNKGSLDQVTRIGGFNEGYSDGLKGNHEVALATTGGYLNGGSNAEILKAAGGTSSDLSRASTNQMVNYVDNHDNLIAFDKLMATDRVTGFTTGKDGKNKYERPLYDRNVDVVNNVPDQLIGQMKIALTSALTSQGIPFTVAGTEFLRTKYGDANSYRSIDAINGINWTRAQTFAAVADYYAGLAAIRKAVSAFTDNTANAINTLSSVNNGLTAWQITNSKSGQWNKIIVALNNSGTAKSLSLTGSWVVVANKDTAGTASLGNASGSCSVPAYSSAILVDSSSFGNYSQPNRGTATVTVEHYVRDDASGTYSLYQTDSAKYKEGQTWRASQSIALLFDHQLDKIESSAAGNATYGSVVANAQINVKFYYTRTVKSGYLIVNFLNTEDESRVKTPMRYRLRDGDEFAIPATAVQGYELDTTRYPAKTIGTFDPDDPATFTFYYKKLANETTIVHYYYLDTRFRNKGQTTILCYCYDDDGNEALGDWPSQSKDTAGLMPDDSVKNPDGSVQAGWEYIEVPTTACRVMFHADGLGQTPDQGEPGYPVCREVWIKGGVLSFSNKVVTSHIDLETGEQLADDVIKDNAEVSSNQTYTTKALSTLTNNYDYVAPANARGFYEAGVTNIVYLYTEKDEPGPGPEPGDGSLIGDANLNGKIDIMDATVIQRHLAHIADLSEEAAANADCDGNGKITVVDANYIQRYLAKIETEDSHVGEVVGGEPGPEPGGEHTFDEFHEIYNELSTEIAKYASATYGSDPHYQAATSAINTYFELIMKGEGTDEEIDAAYDACKAALDGLGEIEIIVVQTVTLYFTNNKNWSSVYAYTWGPSGQSAWPGERLYSGSTNEMGQQVFEFTVDANDSVIFNGDSEGQTVDIVVSSLGGNGIYCLDTTDGNGHYEIGTYDHGGSGDEPEYVEPVSTGRRMYLVPSEEWKSGSARFAAYFFDDASNTYTWVNLKYYNETTYCVDIPLGFSSMIYVRMKGSSTENNWNNKWNESETIDVVPGSTYTVEGWG